MADHGLVGDILRVLAVGIFMLGYYIYKTLSDKKNKVPGDAVAVGQVKSLSVYPVKSLRHIDAPEAQCSKRGLVLTSTDRVADRTWMVVSETRNFVSQRQEPRLALIQPSAAEGATLQLDAPDMPTLRLSKYLSPQTSPVVDVKVWGEPLPAVDCGNEASEWIQTFLKKPGFRLVFSAPSMKTRRLQDGPTAEHKKFQNDDEVAFPDLAPLLLFSEASVEDVKSRLTNCQITEYNFRPNIYVTGCKAFEEDVWNEIYIGEAILRSVRKCDRCLLTTVNPSTGIKDPTMEPLATLRSYRKLVPEYGNSPCFGVHLSVLQEGLVRVGDTVYVV